VSRPASHGDLLELLRRGGPTTRRELLARTGLSRATLWQRIDSLRAHRLVREERGPDGSRGRPAGRLHFDESSRRILVADLGATHATLAVTDLSARRLAVDRRPLDLRDGPRAVLPQVLQSAEDLLGAVPPAARGLLGIGVGFPGLADERRGAIEAPAVLREWDGVPLAERFGRRFGAEALLVNDAHAMAYGEYLAGGRRTLLVVKASTGIGAGLVVDGRLHRGESMGAGQIGHMRLPGSRRRCGCGETGCLATVASGRALLRRLRRVKSLGDLRDAVEAGDAQAVAAVRTAGEAVGTVLSGIVTAIDPGAVLFGGILGRLDVFVEAARAPMASHTYARTAGHVTVGRTALGEESAVVGLAGLVVDSFLSPAAVDALVEERARSRA
jgi:glucokinase